MKFFLKVAAWVGMGFIALGLPLSFSSSITLTSTGHLGSGVGYWLAVMLGIFGTLLILIGGFIAKPRYLWIGTIVIGLVYISSFYGVIPELFENWTVWGLPGASLIYLSPGLACVIGGIVMQRVQNKRMGIIK